jgi:trans-2,3-dihydro-3-hydroxyanthranilate isomerase
MTDELPTSELPTGELRAGELPTGELRAGELRAGELRAGELRTGELRTGELAADELGARGLRTGKFRAGELWASEPEGGARRRYLIADVFTSTPLEGNQLAVFPDGHGLDDDLMQRTARELNLSETVFFLPAERAGDARVRIFTKATELPFAGHPVLGSAFVLGEALGAAKVTLETGAGPVLVELERDGDQIVFGWMEQPIPVFERYERATEVLAALGVARSGLPVEAYRNGPTHVYVELASEAEVAAIQPDQQALGELRVGVCAFAGSGASWKARMFAPFLGVPEDPATGSAAGPLAVHLARHGRTGFGEEIEIRQGEEIGRPSRLYARADGSADKIERVLVGGSAVIVARGEYRLG